MIIRTSFKVLGKESVRFANAAGSFSSQNILFRKRFKHSLRVSLSRGVEQIGEAKSKKKSFTPTGRTALRGSSLQAQGKDVARLSFGASKISRQKGEVKEYSLCLVLLGTLVSRANISKKEEV